LKREITAPKERETKMVNHTFSVIRAFTSGLTPCGGYRRIFLESATGLVFTGDEALHNRCVVDIHKAVRGLLHTLAVIGPDAVYVEADTGAEFYGYTMPERLALELMEHYISVRFSQHLVEVDEADLLIQPRM